MFIEEGRCRCDRGIDSCQHPLSTPKQHGIDISTPWNDMNMEKGCKNKLQQNDMVQNSRGAVNTQQPEKLSILPNFTSDSKVCGGLNC